jgi:hypothetical protein
MNGARSVAPRLLALLVLVLPAAAQAAPLTLYELDQMPVALACRDLCAAQPAVDRAACLSACQYPVLPAWEKNNTPPVDRLDFMLAVLEYWDGGQGAAICYEGGAVVAKAECDRADCLSRHTAAECTDLDADGLLAWEEALIGTDPNVKQTACTSNATCGFTGECDFKFEIGSSLCLARACGGAPCTAFHLEKVSSNAQELILRVHFDYSPVPVTVLDLRVLYSATDLVLVDARALARLTQAGKSVSVTHPAAGVLRLVVLGTGSMTPVPNGDIVELVFQRVTTRQTEVKFDLADIYQRNSMAPSQGSAQAALAQDALWGPSVAVGAADPAGPRLVLAYSFDSLGNPLEYSDVPTAERLCGWMGESACPPGGLARTTALAALGLLQSGSMAARTLLPGVNGNAVYFDGTWDHLDLPVALNDPLTVEDQSSSLSMWLLPEGRSADELAGNYYQVLWSHQRNDDESLRYGIRVVENSQDAARMDLVWFDDGSSSGTTTIMAGLPLHKWVHLGMTLNARSGLVQLFVDGALAKEVPLAKSPSLSCPQLGIGSVASPPVALHKQGNDNTKVAEAIYLARPENGLFGIDRVDPSGFGLASVVRSGDATYHDPDYSPLVDKLVYSSNKSGSSEIWFADGNGANPQKLTTGFGDADHEIFARRPRWAPDASGIIFESNAFDSASGDNPQRVYHLYYVAYDTTPAAALPNLDYQAKVRSQELYKSRITASGAEHHTGAAWLRGKYSGSLGDIAFNAADPLYRSFEVHTITLPEVFTATPPSEGKPSLPGSSVYDVDSSTRLLAANGRFVSGSDVSRLLYLSSRTSFSPASNFSLSEPSVSLDPQTGKELTEVRVLHTPPAGCTGTCLPTEIPSLYLSYDDAIASVDLATSKAGSGLPPDKQVDLRDIGFTNDTQSWRFVRISVSASTSAPIGAGAEIAVLHFVSEVTGLSLDLKIKERHEARSLYLQDRALTSPAQPLAVRSDLLEEISEAAFSPDGKRLLLAGVSRARPTLVRADLVDPDPAVVGAPFTLRGEQVIEVSPTRTEGLSWTKVDRFMPCNRVAASRDPTLQLYQHGFRGALDELKVYSYVRDGGGFRSDAERGHDWLRAAHRDGILEAIRPTCTGLDTECPPYMVCNAATNRCERKTCDPTVAGSCAGHGICSYRPLAIEDESSGTNWLCVSECNTDSQCFQHDCLNGPCRFCTSGACNECNVVEKDYGSFTVRETVGCPDANAWACENGNCVSQCYSLANGVSKYLCNPSEEYCLRGRCEPMKWDWSELAPSSLAGLGEMRLNTAPLVYPIARSRLVPIAVNAYGVEDYGHSPELLVEGRIADSEQPFLAQWFAIGRILVNHRTQDEADSAAYTVVTPYPITELRLRLVTPPLENFNLGSTGFGFAGEDKDRAPGSKFALGYELGIPRWRVYEACDGDAGKWESCSGRRTTDPFRAYMRGGQPAVVIRDVKVNGTGVLANPETKDRICSYEGTAEVPGLKEPIKKVFYGGIATEKSNEKELYCKTHPCSGAGQPSVLNFDVSRGGLLNCNYYDPARPDDSAGLFMSFPAPQFGSIGGGITENANGCTIEQQAGSAVIRIPCYEVADGDGSFDVMNPGQEPMGSHGLLDFDIFRFFAWDSRGP